MSIAELCIKRPVLATVINLVIILLGIVSWQRLTVREYPNIDVPVVTVQTKYVGANANIIETQVTKPLEDAISGIEGIDYVKSISRAEQSQITIRFKLERNADSAAADVRDRVGRARDLLPEAVEEPIIAKTEADAQPIIWLALSSDTRSALQVSDLADRIVQDRLQTLPGVADVILFANRQYAMRVDVNTSKLAAYNLTVQDVEDALRTQNVEIPAGRIQSAEREFTVLAQTDLNTPAEFQNVIIKTAANGHLVRLGEVANIFIGPAEERQIARYNKQASVALGVVKQSVANPLQISEAVRKVLPELEKILPKDVKLAVAYDSSIFIDRSIKAVFHTIFEATILVVLVIFLFLRSFRATIIPLIAIPVSLIGTMAMMYMMGFSINTLTLLALVIAIGLVVDDAIVVLENIYRHIEEGMKPMQAALLGMREISFAVIAMTVTLAAVFAPMAFTPGRTGKLFIEFALALAGAVIISGITALTLTPTMCARLLKHEDHQAGWSKWIEHKLRWVEVNYKIGLRKVLGQRGIVVIVALCLFGVAAFVFTTLPNELAPTEDRGVILGIGIAPEGSTIDYSDRYAKQMEAMIQALPEYSWNFIAVGFPYVTQSITFAGLKDWDVRPRNVKAILAELGPKFMGITGTLNFPTSPPPLGQDAIARPVEFVIQSTSDTYETLNAKIDQILAKVAANKAIIVPDTDLKLNKPELKVSFAREKLAQNGISVETVGRTLETLFGQRKVQRFKQNSEQYDVLVRLSDEDRRNPQDLTNVYVHSNTGELVKLVDLLNYREGVAPRELNHFNKLRAVTIQANLAPTYPLGEALQFMAKVTREVDPGLSIDYGGVSREFKEASGSLAFIFMLALLFIYLVLAAQFESFVDPLVILLSVPLAIGGALTALKFTGGSINVYSQIGLVALIGLITKHGIMIVEFANQLQMQGKAKRMAVIESASIRLRPILMTTFAMVLGAVPLAFAGGAGAEARQSIGWVLVGGMSVGTLFTLFVVPTFYTIMARVHQPDDAENDNTRPAQVPHGHAYQAPNAVMQPHSVGPATTPDITTYPGAPPVSTNW